MNRAATTVSPKVTAGGTAGALAIVLVWILGEFDVTMPAEVAMAVAVLASVVAGYLKTDPLRTAGRHAAR